jgi:hypothetical protein
MNWKLIGLLSLFGLAMGIATVFVISSDIEPYAWLVIFLVTAYAIARGTPRARFQHGLLVGIGNSVWVTTCHILLFATYIAGHPREAAMMASTPLPDSPRLMMAMIGPVIGVVTGLVMGAFAVVAARLIRVPLARGGTPPRA